MEHKVISYIGDREDKTQSLVMDVGCKVLCFLSWKPSQNGRTLVEMISENKIIL